MVQMPAAQWQAIQQAIMEMTTGFQQLNAAIQGRPPVPVAVQPQVTQPVQTSLPVTPVVNEETVEGVEAGHIDTRPKKKALSVPGQTGRAANPSTAKKLLVWVVAKWMGILIVVMGVALAAFILNGLFTPSGKAPTSIDPKRNLNVKHQGGVVIHEYARPVCGEGQIAIEVDCKKALENGAIISRYVCVKAGSDGKPAVRIVAVNHTTCQPTFAALPPPGVR